MHGRALGIPHGIQNPCAGTYTWRNRSRVDTQMRWTEHGVDMDSDWWSALTEVEEDVEEWHEECAAANACCSGHRPYLQDTDTSARCRSTCCCPHMLLQCHGIDWVPLVACHNRSVEGSPPLTGLARIYSCRSCPTYACECLPLLHWLPYRHPAAHQQLATSTLLMPWCQECREDRERDGRCMGAQAVREQIQFGPALHHSAIPVRRGIAPPKRLCWGWRICGLSSSCDLSAV